MIYQYNLSLQKTKELIESKPKGFFKGIIPVNFAGLPVDLEKFRRLADEHDLWIIEDACHAPGGYFIDSKNNKQMCGNCNFAEIGVFSFHPVKHIACGEGGMITTNSKRLYEKISLLRTHGIIKNNNIFQKNDSIIINGGVFSGSTALFDKYTSGKNRVNVLLNMMGVSTKMSLDTHHIQKI